MFLLQQIWSHIQEQGLAHFESNSDCTGSHLRNWRRLATGLYYSIEVLFPEQYSNSQRRPQARPNIKSVDINENIDNVQPHISTIDWSSEGFGIPDDDNQVPTEYLFDRGATEAVSNNCSQLVNYLPLPSPIPIHTATTDSNAFILVKGKLQVAAEDGGMTTIDDVFDCPRATTTIISPGALVKKGAQMTINDDNDFRIVLSDGKTIYTKHKNKQWFIKSRTSHRNTFRPIHEQICTMKPCFVSSQLWKIRMGHVSMKRI